MIAALDPGEWARRLSISREAVELYLSSEVIDLHLDSFIWHRIFGYRLDLGHRRASLGGYFWGHADFPRVRQAGLSGATWVITTNPLREASERFSVLLSNLRRFEKLVAKLPEDLSLVRTLSEYRAARSRGKHAAFIGIQGGNALDGERDSIERLPPLLVLRVTLLHLSGSRLGSTSSPLGIAPERGLTDFGREFVRRLNQARILVDLAHIAEPAFWDALEVHDPKLPVLVTHTGVAGVHRHWRNLNDAQLRAIAGTGGVVGVMFYSSFLGDRWWSGRAARIVDHLAHIVRVAGEETPALGSDFDGAIIPPRDLQSVLELPRLVELMLKRGFSLELVQRILGGNFLRMLAAVRP